ncbi:MAG: L,D-transpeptidase [Nocardioidaceae bacterium]
MPGQPQQRRARPAPVGAHPRYARITAAAGSLGVTVVAVLGGIGLLPTESASAGQPAARGTAARSAASVPADRGDDGAISLQSSRLAPKPAAAGTAGQDVVPGLPASSGTGRRIVFDMHSQRVWLVAQRRGEDAVTRTYLVSGSVTDNLSPGTYQVYSRSMRAWGIDDSGSMRYMVRFAHGQNAAIGFHDIPVLDGALVQSRDQLGTPESHGCIRQWRPDARALWDFAPVGTEVVVT